jgi:hypothetical protein
MKLTNMKLTGLLAGTVLTIASFGAYAGESHIAQAIKDAEAAANATEGKIIAEHAETAKTHLISKILQLGEANMPDEARWWPQRQVDATEASQDGSAC